MPEYSVIQRPGNGHPFYELRRDNFYCATFHEIGLAEHVRDLLNADNTDSVKLPTDCPKCGASVSWSERDESRHLCRSCGHIWTTADNTPEPDPTNDPENFVTQLLTGEGLPDEYSETITPGTATADLARLGWVTDNEPPPVLIRSMDHNGPTKLVPIDEVTVRSAGGGRVVRLPVGSMVEVPDTD